ncbi:unnamed protein product [Cylicocyclus nassatus]|uniref:RING-type domain-containing protein n=1 Tax=Cylicocyclus nassatus TaxID=53992 RepID=A0AA36GW07_CYLNA|nr:unnamed protein product [Cylicocyclus nassatus]
MCSSVDALRGLVPNCLCGAEYDLRFCAPYTLPCAHTFCLICLSKDEQRKKRRCPSCHKKYSSFILNIALSEVVNRVRQRREWLAGRSRRCDECESRHPLSAMRRCVTCVREIGKHVSVGCTLDCVICLECCVERHNGHELVAVTSRKTQPSAIVYPVASSTPRSNSLPLYVQERASTSKEAIMDPQNQRLMNPQPPGAVVTAGSKLGSIVQARNPIYYQTSLSDTSPSEGSIVSRISGFVRGIASSRQNVANQNHYEKYQQKFPRKSCNASNRNSIDTDISSYQRISPHRSSSGSDTNSDIQQKKFSGLSQCYYCASLSRACVMSCRQ